MGAAYHRFILLKGEKEKPQDLVYNHIRRTTTVRLMETGRNQIWTWNSWRVLNIEQLSEQNTFSFWGSAHLPRQVLTPLSPHTHQLPTNFSHRKYSYGTSPKKPPVILAANLVAKKQATNNALLQIWKNPPSSTSSRFFQRPWGEAWHFCLDFTPPASNALMKHH